MPSLGEIVARTGAVLTGRRLCDRGATSSAEAKLYGGDPVKLETVGVTPVGQVTSLRYRARRESTAPGMG